MKFIHIKKGDLVLLKENLLSVRYKELRPAGAYAKYLNKMSGTVVQIGRFSDYNSGNDISMRLGKLFVVFDGDDWDMYQGFVEKVLTPENNPEYFL